MVDLNNKEQMQDFCNNIAAAKLIAEELGENPTYEKIVRISDELNISIEEVQGYLRLYKFIQSEMVI